MNKTIYGIQGVGESTIILTPDQIPICQNSSGQALTPTLLKSYIDRANGLLNTLATARPPIATTLNLLDVIRQELCVLTSKTYRPLPPPPEIGITYTANGKYQMETTLS
jgi:hypothetical protein